MLCYCTNDILTHIEVYIRIKNGDPNNISCTLKSICGAQILFTAYVTIASAGAIGASEEGIDAVLNAVAFVFLIDFDNWMFSLAAKIFVLINEELLIVQVPITDSASRDESIINPIFSDSKSCVVVALIIVYVLGTFCVFGFTMNYYNTN